MGKLGKEGLRRWRGLKSLVHDAVDATTDLVELGHESTAPNVTAVTDQVPPLRRPARVIDEVRRLGTRGVLGTVKLVNGTVNLLAPDPGSGLAFGRTSSPTLPLTHVPLLVSGSS